MEVTLGGQRLGSGNKQNLSIRNYERSTHDLSYVWRSTMSAGTLVPFMTEVALPGDTFDIDLTCECLTHPTIGPLFGTYKIQLDVFQVPIRLYQGKLHMNALNIGMDMAKVKLPQIIIEANNIDSSIQADNQQINPSSIFSYLGIRGLGYDPTTNPSIIKRAFNGIPFLGYWDIYKNYYANKMEGVGAVIHREIGLTPIALSSATFKNSSPNNQAIGTIIQGTPTWIKIVMQFNSYIEIITTGDLTNFSPKQLRFLVKTANGVTSERTADTVFKTWTVSESLNKITGSSFSMDYGGTEFSYCYYANTPQQINPDTEPKVVTFPLVNIDEMRNDLLAAVRQATPFEVSKYSAAPYVYPFQSFYETATQKTYFNATQNQEGLALKTYQSDLFNNWIKTDWIDGTDGISNITAITIGADGKFTIDELNLSKKIYDMLNRIALSGGTYDDWLDAVYTHDRQRAIESPMYLGGLIKNLVFEEVISNSAVPDQPLGTLAGRGRIGNKHKGGKIIAKIDEPSYIMGIVSLTPNIDYSQGNKWDMNLRTMNDFHKPALDAIGFQDLITDQICFWDTIQEDGVPYTQVFKSAGKQPAWINYMTNVNQIKGNFADQGQQMFMTLNRRYEQKPTAAAAVTIKDLTTYIDPSKFNHIFANTRRDAQNFWMQIGVNITARRKMSAKVIPNL